MRRWAVYAENAAGLLTRHPFRKFLTRTRAVSHANWRNSRRSPELRQFVRFVVVDMYAPEQRAHRRAR